MTIWNRSIHKNKKKDLLKNQRFVLMGAYLNSHSVGWIDLLAYKCILMDCSENLTVLFDLFKVRHCFTNWKKESNESLLGESADALTQKFLCNWGTGGFSWLMGAWLTSGLTQRMAEVESQEMLHKGVQRILGQFIWVFYFVIFKWMPFPFKARLFLSFLYIPYRSTALGN